MGEGGSGDGSASPVPRGQCEVTGSPLTSVLGTGSVMALTLASVLVPDSPQAPLLFPKVIFPIKPCTCTLSQALLSLEGGADSVLSHPALETTLQRYLFNLLMR